MITKRDQLVNIINELNLKRGVEVGVHKGGFSEHLLQNSSLEKLYSIDAWSSDEELTKSARRNCEKNEGKMDECYKECCERLSKFGDRSVIMKDLSENAVKNFEDESLDFVYLDASHRFTGITLDLINWWEKTKWGGLFAGHDYWRRYRYEVMYAVNGFCMDRRQFFYVTTDERQFPQYGPSWWLIKTKTGNAEFRHSFKEYKKILKKQSEDILNNKKIRIDIPYECQN